MSDRPDELAKSVVHDAWRSWPGDISSEMPGEPANVIEHMTVRVASALRAYAEEARKEERDIAAKDAEMRYEDGYACGVKDEREACATVIDIARGKLKGRWSLDSSYLELAAAALRARGEGKG